MITTFVCKNAGGFFRISATEKALCSIERLPQSVPVSSVLPLLVKITNEQLDEYFRGERTTFTLPLQFRGTPFQLSVWKCIVAIPYGETCSYTDIAQAIGRPTSVRAVGAACRANPFLIVVPCHRVVGKKGKLTGYVNGLTEKMRLLQLEKDILCCKGLHATLSESTSPFVTTLALQPPKKE